MKIRNITLAIFTATIIFAVGCSSATQTISEESLGLRNTNIYIENKDTVGDKAEYTKKAAGESKLIDRAFENAPPMIPHNVEGMLPITINNNACQGCHSPSIAQAINATPIPKSHFTDFRPRTSLSENGKIKKEGKVIINTSDFKNIKRELETLSGTRYNCSACHTPQSITKIPVINEFKADFRQKNSNKKSNLINNINEGINTIK